MGSCSALSIISEIASILSFLISIVTIILAAGIKRSVNRDRTESDFEKEIDDQIDRLGAYEQIFLEKYNILDYTQVTKLDMELGDISTAYDGFLKKNVLKSIKSLKAFLQQQFKPDSKSYSQKSCHECAKQIQVVIGLLRRQRRLK